MFEAEIVVSGGVHSTVEAWASRLRLCFSAKLGRHHHYRSDSHERQGYIVAILSVLSAGPRWKSTSIATDGCSAGWHTHPHP